MSFWTYILRCSDGTYYTGHTDDLDRRIAEHQSGIYRGYTHDRRPVTLMWADSLPSRHEALDRERQIKDWSRAKKEALFQSDWQAITEAARSRLRVSTSLDARSNPTDNEDISTQPPPPPAIILVRPQLGENIGKAARAMLNFGLVDLRLVAPRDGWPNPSAGAAASGADRVLAEARVFDTVADAVADCPHVYATTVRKRGVEKPVVTPEVAAGQVHAGSGRSAFLFGPERSGLETDDVALARTIVTVPINPEFGSLNLAQAVILVAYEWSKGMALAQPTLTEAAPPAPQEALEGLIAHLDRILEPAGYYFPPDRALVDRRQLRGILTAPGWSAGMIRTLRGVLRSIERNQKN